MTPALLALSPVELRAYLDAVQPIVIAVLTLVLGTVGTWFGVEQLKKTQRQNVDLLLDALTQHIQDAVAFVYQTQVKEAKDPLQPQKQWDGAAMHRAKDAVTERVHLVAARVIRELDALGTDTRTVIAQKIEKAVFDLNASLADSPPPVVAAVAAPGAPGATGTTATTVTTTTSEVTTPAVAPASPKPAKRPRLSKRQR